MSAQPEHPSAHLSERRSSARVSALVILALLLLAAGAAAEQVVIQNDTLADFQQAAICPCFVTGEEAAAWLTSTCDGNLVALQISWFAFLGGGTESLEAAVLVYDGSTFPSPGATLFSPLIGPVLTEGFLNELMVPPHPVATGQTFVVSLEFGTSNLATLGPSVVHDNDGCKPNRNAVFAVPGGWTDACTIGGGIAGNWVIRAVVDCDDSIVFRDGFESGSTSGWSLEEPLP